MSGLPFTKEDIMKNQASGLELLLISAIVWIGLTAAIPLTAQAQITGKTPSPEAEDAGPGFLRLSPANEDDDGNRFPLNWPTLTAKRLQRQLTSPSCSANYQNFVFFYPQGFGNAALDGEIERAVTDSFSQAVEERRQNGFCGQTDCGSDSCRGWNLTRTFEVHRPSANYVSILYTDYSDTGGVQPGTAYEAANYDLSTGQPMSLLGLFAQPQESAPKYWEMVYKRWCENASVKFPLHYQNPEPCGAPDSLTNPNTYSWASTLSDLGRLIFTPQGACLVIGPDESGPRIYRTVVMDFDKTELIAVGASPSVWGQ